jgi:hypothetical protein
MSRGSRRRTNCTGITAEKQDGGSQRVMVSLGLDERVLAVVAEGVRHLLVSFFLFGEQSRRVQGLLTSRSHRSTQTGKRNRPGKRRGRDQSCRRPHRCRCLVSKSHPKGQLRLFERRLECRGRLTRRGAGVARSTAVGSVGLGVEADDRVARGERGEALRAAVRAGRAGSVAERVSVLDGGASLGAALSLRRDTLGAVGAAGGKASLAAVRAATGRADVDSVRRGSRSPRVADED